ncbi:MAG: ATP-dependent Clp protease ATP-binding subunit ClpA, partial [Roseibium sp.]
LFGKLKKGGMVKVSVSEDKAGLLLESLEERAPTPPKSKAKPAAKPKRRRKPAAPKAKAETKAGPKSSGDKSGPKKSLVPKVPLAD